LLKWIRYGVRVNQPNAVGETALHYAVRMNNEKLVALFASNGADPTLKSTSNESPIDLAASKYANSRVLNSNSKTVNHY
jgi:ankyrin repeat protein